MIRVKLTGCPSNRITPPVDQPEKSLIMANPIAGVEYDLLPLASNVRILGMWANCAWSVQPSNLQILGYIDGETWKWNRSNPVSMTAYFACISMANSKMAQTLSTTQYDMYRAFLLEGRSVRLTCKLIGGTSSMLMGYLMRQGWP